MKNLLKHLQSITRPVVFGLFAVVLMSSLCLKPLTGAIVKAQTADDLRQKTEALKSQLDNNNATVKSLELQAGSLQDKLTDLANQITTTTIQIASTQAKIEQLTTKLIETETELERQKGLLRNTFRSLYQKGNVSSVELLVGSDSFTAYFNGQTYRERIKDSIQVSAKKVIELKDQVIQQKKDQEDLAVQQKAQKQGLENNIAEQANILQVTKGEQAKYDLIVKDNEAQLAAAQAELDALLAKLAREAAERERQNGGGPIVSYGHVYRGQRIGSVGSTGLSTGPHTHFAVYDNGVYVDPVQSNGVLINGYMWPLPNSNWSDISQWFGCTDLTLEPYASWCPTGHVHYGMDIGGWYGDPVVAAAEGDITYRGWLGGYGYVVIVYHGNGVQTFYPHMIPE